MQTESFILKEEKLQAFKNACEQLHTVKFVKYEDEIVFVEFKYAHTLFYLGQMFELKLRLESLV
jgi:hypothetical protein